MHGAAVHAEQGCAGQSRQDGGVGGQDELRPCLGQPVQLAQKGQLPLGGQGGLRLVRQVQPAGTEVPLDQMQETLQVRLSVEAPAAVAGVEVLLRVAVPVVLGPGGHVAEALRLWLGLRPSRMASCRGE